MDASNPKSGSCCLVTISKARDDGFDHQFRLLGTLDRDGLYACFFGGIVIPAREERIADVNHLLRRNVQEVSQLGDSVCLIDARLGDIDRCRAPDANGKFGNIVVKNRFDLLPLGVIRIPFILFF
jgi:hypothetical protein